jgi:hypothetical protein
MGNYGLTNCEVFLGDAANGLLHSCKVPLTVETVQCRLPEERVGPGQCFVFTHCIASPFTNKKKMKSLFIKSHYHGFKNQR